MYFLYKGSCQVLDDEVMINTIYPKRLFGELALIYHETRSKSVVAMEEVTVFRLHA